MDNLDGCEFRVRSMSSYLLDWVINSDFAPSEIAREAGVTKASISVTIKTKKWGPRLSTLIGIARAHDVLIGRQNAYDEQQKNEETKP